MTIHTQELLKSIEQASKFAPLKSSQPVLKNVYLESNTNELKIITTDLDDIYKNTLYQAQGIEFNTAVSVSAIQKILKNIKDINVHLDFKDDILYIITKKTTYKLTTLASEEYPTYYTRDFNVKEYKAIIQDVALDTLKKVGQAAAKYEPNNLLSAIHYRTNTSTLAASNGDILYTCKLSAPVLIDNHEIMFSVNTVNNLLNKSYEIGELDVSIPISSGDNIDKKFIVFKNDSEYIYTRSYKGQYPKYEQLIPHHNTNIVDIKADSLNTALKEVELTCNDRTGITKLKFRDNQLYIETSTPDIGETITEAEAEKIEVKPELKTIAFNMKYLKNVLKLGKDLHIQLDKQLSVARIDIDNFTCLLMPIQVRDAA